MKNHTRNTSGIITVGLCLAFALLAYNAGAQTQQYWDNNGTNAATGGTWDVNTTTNWAPSSTLAASTFTYTNNNFPIFTAGSTTITALTINVPGAVICEGIGNGTTDTGTSSGAQVTALTFSGAGSINLPSGSWNFECGSAGNMAFNVPITGSGAIVQHNGGSFALNVSNSYSGGTFVTGGQVIYYLTNGSFGTGAINVGGSGNALVNNTSPAAALTIPNNFVFPTAGYALNLAGGNAVSGNPGTTFTGNFPLPSSGTITLETSSTSSEVTEISGVISGASAVSVQDAGTMIFAGANTYTGATSIGGLGNGATPLKVSSLNKVSGGSASSSLGAPTTVANGTVAMGSAANAAVLIYTGVGETSDRVINLAGTTGGATIENDGSGPIAFSSAFTATGVGVKTLTLQGTSTATNSILGAIVNNSSGNTTALTKAQAGNWILDGVNTFTGSTTISAGALTIGGSGSLNSGTYAGAIANSGTLTYNSSASQTLSGIVSGAGTYVQSGSGTVTMSGANTYTGGNTLSGGVVVLNKTETAGASGPLGKSADANPGFIVMSGGTLRYTTANNQHDYSGRFSTAASQQYKVDVNGAAVTYASALVSSGGALTVSSTAGGGMLTLTGTNSYTGQTSVTGTTLALNNASGLDTVLGTAPATPVANQLVLNNANLSLGSASTLTLNTNRGITLTGADSLFLSNKDLTLPNNIAGTGSLTKNGANAVVLGGSNSFSGGFAVTQGTVYFVTSNSVGTGLLTAGPTIGLVTLRSSNNPVVITNNVTVNGGGTKLIDMVVATGDTLTFSGQISGAGGLYRGNGGGPGNVVLLGSNTNFSGGITFQQGGLIIGNQYGLGTGTFIFEPTGSANNAVVLQANTLLTGTNAITNTVQFAVSNATQQVTIGGSSNLEFAGPVILGQSGSLSPVITNNNTGTTLISGVISGPSGIGLTSAGTGTLTLSNANTYTGPTAISSGTLALAAAGSISNSSAVSIAAGATFDVSAISAYAFGSTGLSASGTASPATINGAPGGTVDLSLVPAITLTYDSVDPALTISQGTLVLNGNTFTVNGPVLAGGIYVLAQQASGNISSSGSFSVNGTAIGAGSTASITVINGNVVLTVFAPPVFSNLNASPLVNYGATSIILTGTVSDGPDYPTNGETVSATINGNTVNGAIIDTNGDFSITYNDPSLPTDGAGAYPISYVYGGNPAVYLLAATNSATSLTVGPASLTITANNDSKTYGQTKAYGAGSMAFTSSPLQNGETIGSVTLSSSGAASGAPVSGSPYAITPSAATGGSFNPNNYSITYHAGMLTVGPASLTVTATSFSIPYGATNPAFTVTYSNFVNGETLGTSDVGGSPTLISAATNGSDVGVYVITNSIGTLTSTNYTFVSFVDGTLTITNAVSSNAVVAIPNPASPTAGLIFTSTLSTLAPSLAVPTNAVQFLLDGVTNGSPVYPSNGVATITNAPLPLGLHTIEADYAGDTNALGATNILGSTNTVALVVNATPVFSGLTASPTIFYGATSVSLSGTVSAGSIYPTNGETVSATINGFTANGTVVDTNGDFLITYNDPSLPTNSVGLYTITYSYAGNPAIFLNAATNSATSLTVGPASLTITANNDSKTYGQTKAYGAGSMAFTSSPLQNGETIGSVTLSSSGAASSAPVSGSPYAITPSAATGGSFNTNNYSITYHAGVLTVGPASLTVTADNLSIPYGAAIPTLTVTYTNFVNGETLGTSDVGGSPSLATGATTNSDAGAYVITNSIGTLTSTNYSLGLVNGTLIITNAVSSNSVAATPNPASPTAGLTFTSTLTTLAPSLAVPTNAVQFLLDGVTNGSPVYPSNGVATITNAPLPLGLHTIEADYAGDTNALGATNILGSTNTVALVVNATPVFSGLTASPTIFYGATSVSLSGTVSAGSIYPTNGETVSATINGFTANGTVIDTNGDFSITYNDPSLPTNSAGAYTITYAYAGNPAIFLNAATNDTSTSLTVSPATLNITAVGQSKVYGQTLTDGSSTNFTSGGLQNGETIGSVTLSYGGGGVSNAPVSGSPYTITPSAATGGTFSAGNYAIAYNNGALAVSPAALSVTASAQSKTYGQMLITVGNTNFTSSGLQNGETIGSVTLSYGGGDASNAPVSGSPYTITPSAATGGTFSAGNYNIGYNPALLTVGPATLTVTADSFSIPYGATNPALTVTYSNFVNGETLGTSDVGGSPALATAATTNSDAGAYDITNSIGTLTSTNYTFSLVDGTLTITNAVSSNSVAVGPNPALPTATVTFTSTLSTLAPSLAVPTNAVQFLVDGLANGSPVYPTNGVATMTNASLSHGYHTIEADYAGDTNALGVTNILGSTNTAMELINTPPVAGTANYLRPTGTPLIIAISDLLTNATDADGDPLTLVSVSTPSTNGAAVSSDTNYVYYIPPSTNADVNDAFLYTVSDNYGATNQGTVMITVFTNSMQSYNVLSITTLGNGTAEISFAGIPNRSYLVQETTNLTPTIIWTTISTNTAGTNGLFQYNDLDSTNYPGRYYRTTTP